MSGWVGERGGGGGGGTRGRLSRPECFAFVCLEKWGASWLTKDLSAHHRQAEEALSGAEVVQKACAQSTEPHLAIKRGENRGTYSGMVA